MLHLDSSLRGNLLAKFTTAPAFYLTISPSTCLPLSSSPPRLLANEHMGTSHKELSRSGMHNQLLSIEDRLLPACIQPAFVNFSSETRSRQLCVMLPFPQQLQWMFGLPVSLSTVCSSSYLSIAAAFDKSTLHPKPVSAEWGRQVQSLNKILTWICKNIRDTFHNEVNSGRGHYHALISLIKSIAVTKKEKTDKGEEAEFEKRHFKLWDKWDWTAKNGR